MSNLTLDLIRNSAVTASSPHATIPTTSRPVPERCQVAGTAFAPRIAMSRPSEAQMDFIKSLLADIVELDAHVGEGLRQTMNEAYFAGALTPGRGNGASRVIDNLVAERDALRVSHRAHSPQVDRPVVPAGNYAVTAEAGHVAFYRVAVNDSGFYTVQLQVSDGFQTLPWNTARSVLKQIETDTPLVASMRYGQELGVCGVCSRTLTNPDSRARGIGPVCAKRLAG